jgi:hypothetical protein
MRKSSKYMVAFLLPCLINYSEGKPSALSFLSSRVAQTQATSLQQKGSMILVHDVRNTHNIIDFVPLNMEYIWIATAPFTAPSQALDCISPALKPETITWEISLASQKAGKRPHPAQLSVPDSILLHWTCLESGPSYKLSLKPTMRPQVFSVACNPDGLSRFPWQLLKSPEKYGQVRVSRIIPGTFLLVVDY